MQLHEFGVTRKEMLRSLRHAAIITATGIVVVTALGFLIGFKALQVDYAWLAFYVMISVPVQELVFRGILQTRLYRFGTPLAIAVASVLYASIHFQTPVLVALTLASGMAWGYSFSRRPTLVGPIASHAVLGVFLFLFVL